MTVYLKSRRSTWSAIGEFNIEDNTLLVKKGAIVSDKIAQFRAASKIARERDVKTVNGILQEDTIFSSPSTAANFITGASTNGLAAWKTADGKSLKTFLSAQ